MLTAERSVSEQAELHLVAHVQGEADDVFRHFDKDSSGCLSRDEIKQVINELRLEAGDIQQATDTDIDDMFSEIRTRFRRGIARSPTWCRCPNSVVRDSSERIREQVIHKFHDLDTDGNGKLDKHEISELLSAAHGQTPSSTEVDALWAEMLSEESADDKDQAISLDEFLAVQRQRIPDVVARPPGRC